MAINIASKQNPYLGLSNRSVTMANSMRSSIYASVASTDRRRPSEIDDRLAGSFLALPRSFLALRDCLWPCEIVYGLARLFMELLRSVLALQDRFWPCRDSFWPCEIVYGITEIVFGLARSFNKSRNDNANKEFWRIWSCPE